MPGISPAFNLLDPNLGIQNILDPSLAGTDGHMPGARPMAANVLREAGLEDLYGGASASSVGKLLEAALCPEVGDGDALRPDVFSAHLTGSLEALEGSRDPAVKAFVRGELRPLLDNAELLKAYTGLMIGG